LDITWEAFRFVAEIARVLILGGSEIVPPEEHLGFDPRFWLFRKAIVSILIRYRILTTENSLDLIKIYRWTKVLSSLWKAVVFVFVIVSVETIVTSNALEGTKNRTLGEMFALLNLIVLLCIANAHLFTRLPPELRQLIWPQMKHTLPLIWLFCLFYLLIVSTPLFRDRISNYDGNLPFWVVYVFGIIIIVLSVVAFFVVSFVCLVVLMLCWKGLCAVIPPSVGSGVYVSVMAVVQPFFYTVRIINVEDEVD